MHLAEAEENKHQELQCLTTITKICKRLLKINHRLVILMILKTTEKNHQPNKINNKQIYYQIDQRRACNPSKFNRITIQLPHKDNKTHHHSIKHSLSLNSNNKKRIREQ